MNKIIIVLCALLAVAYGSNLHDDVDNYIDINVAQYKRILDSYDEELSQFREHFKGRIEAIAVQKEMVIATIVQTEERINPLLLLSGSSKQCVVKYRNNVAGVEVTKQAITKCELIAFTQLRTLLNAAISVRNALLHNIENYKNAVNSCGHENYTSCVTAVTANANKFTFENQKAFEYEYEAAQCLAKAHVKEVVDCTYSVKIEVLTKLGVFEANIGRCLIGEDECHQCEEYTCPDAANVYGNFENQTIANPLYGRTDKPKCLQLYVH